MSYAAGNAWSLAPLAAFALTWQTHTHIGFRQLSISVSVAEARLGFLLCCCLGCPQGGKVRTWSSSCASLSSHVLDRVRAL